MLLALQFQLSTFRKHNVYFHSALRFHCISSCTALLFSLLPCNLQKLSCVLAEFDTYVSPGSLILYTSPLNIRISSSHNTRNDFSVNTGKTEVTFKGLIPSPSSLEQGTCFREDPICFARGCVHFCFCANKSAAQPAVSQMGPSFICISKLAWVCSHTQRQTRATS